MKAICIYPENPKRIGDIVDLGEIYITRIWKNGVEISTSDETGYHKAPDILLSMLREGDIVEDNYCHGQYRIVAD